MREGQALVFEFVLVLAVDGRLGYVLGSRKVLPCGRTTHSKGFTERSQRDVQETCSRRMRKREAPEGCASGRLQRDAQAAGFVFEILVSKCWFSFVLMKNLV